MEVEGQRVFDPSHALRDVRVMRSSHKGCSVRPDQGFELS